MHSVQAAPRQRPCLPARTRTRYRCTPCRQRRGKVSPNATCTFQRKDALRAGSAEAKTGELSFSRADAKMHSVQAAPRQRRWRSARRSHRARCTPCRQRRGKDGVHGAGGGAGRDALRAGSAEAKNTEKRTQPVIPKMHSVQAAPRQSHASMRSSRTGTTMHSVQAAPRQRQRRNRRTAHR